LCNFSIVRLRNSVRYHTAKLVIRWVLVRAMVLSRTQRMEEMTLV
jgi:hypothetical protein